MFYGSIGGKWVVRKRDLWFVAWAGGREKKKETSVVKKKERYGVKKLLGRKQILLMFEQIIAFTLHLSISMWVYWLVKWSGGKLSLWCRKYKWVWWHRGKSGFQQFSLYVCRCTMAIKDVDLTLISRAIFQSLRGQPKLESLEFNQLEAERKMMKRKTFFFAIECSMIRKVGRLTISLCAFHCNCDAKTFRFLLRITELEWFELIVELYLKRLT